MIGAPVGASFGATGIHLNKSEQPGQLPDRYELLFIGNSHSSTHNLPGLVSTLIETGVVGSSTLATAAPDWGLLTDRLNDGVPLQSLNSSTTLSGQRRWSSH